MTTYGVIVLVHDWDEGIYTRAEQVEPGIYRTLNVLLKDRTLIFADRSYVVGEMEKKERKATCRFHLIN